MVFQISPIQACKILTNTYIYLFSGASISFDTVLLWVDISSIFMGFTVFFAVVQFMELLGLNRHISMLSSTLRVKEHFLLVLKDEKNLSKTVINKNRIFS